MKATPVLIALYCWFSFASPVFAGDSDPCAGPAFNVDLQKDMPPVDDQGQSPWCATFTTRAILDYNRHMDCLKSHPGDAASGCAYSPATRVSPADVNSLDSQAPDAVRGTHFNRVSGASVFALLEGVQRDGALTEQQLPFDQAVFGTPSDASVLSRLSDYYDKRNGQPASASQLLSSCSPAEDGVYADLQRRFPDIQKILNHVSNKSDFIDSVMSEIPESLRNERAPAVPAFDIHEISSGDPIVLKNHILETLKQSQPLATGVCARQLAANTGISIQGDFADGCGAHALTLIGFRKSESGKCEVHLRNSWGKEWPYDRHGDGTVWIDADAYMNSLIRSSDGKAATDLVSISPRDGSQPIQNHISVAENEITGKTWKMKIQEGTVKFPDGETQTGTFEGGRLKKGKDAHSDGSFYKGTFENGRLVNGTTRFANGVIARGQWENGELVCGTMKKSGTIWCMHHGQGNKTTKSMDPRSCGCEE